MLAYYCLLYNVKMAFNTKKWSLSLVQSKELISAAKSKIWSQPWDWQFSTKDSTFTTTPKARLTSYSSDVMIFTWNLIITKLDPPPLQISTTRQDRTGFLMLSSYPLIFDVWSMNTTEKFINSKMYEDGSKKITVSIKNID